MIDSHTFAESRERDNALKDGVYFTSQCLGIRYTVNDTVENHITPQHLVNISQEIVYSCTSLETLYFPHLHTYSIPN